MNDEAKLYYFFHNSNEMKTFINRFEFRFLVNRNGNFIGRLRNLFLIVFPNEYKLRVSGSLHKFYKGENHSTFTRRENEFALIELEELIKIPLEKFKVKGIAVGLNIRLNDLPENYLPIPISYRNKLFREYPPKQGNRIIERICNGVEMSSKFYDKSAQFYQTEKVRLYSPLIFRFERVFHKMRGLHKKFNRTHLTAQDLTTELFLVTMAKNHLLHFETIDKKLEMNLSNITPRDYCFIESFPNIPPEIKKKHKESYKKDRSYYLKLKKTLQFSDSKVKELREKFKNEVEKILSD